MSSTDKDLFGTMIKVENKDIFVDLRQNTSGVYLKLSERNGRSRNTVLIPASGISRLKSVLEEVQSISLKNTRISHERKSRIAGDPAVVTRSVYVSGLAWSTNEMALRVHFENVAPVVSAVVLRRNRGGKSSSLGCGVVEFETPDLAAVAVQQLNDSELDGRTIKCREDRAIDTNGSGNGVLPAGGGVNPVAGMQPDAVGGEAVGPGNPAVGGGRVRDPNKVFVTSLSWQTTGEKLEEICSTVGKVVSAEILMNKKGRSLGHGVVHFADPAAATAAVATLDREILDQREITVREFYMA